jgi:molybdate transport system substrate-binding protein
MRRSTLAFVLAAALALAAPAAASALNVYAATSLTKAFPALDKGPTYSFGGSNTLQLQIERGAPADVFASASQTEAQTLFKEGLCTRPVTFATNRLVLLIPNSNPGHITSVYSLRSGGRRLSIGNAGVPVGDYTRQLLKRMRLSGILRSNRVSQQTNVGQVASQVALGAADAGFVYRTDLVDGLRAVSLPGGQQPVVEYGAGVVKGGRQPELAEQYLDGLSNGACAEALRSAGFGAP